MNILPNAKMTNNPVPFLLTASPFVFISKNVRPFELIRAVRLQRRLLQLRDAGVSGRGDCYQSVYVVHRLEIFYRGDGQL